MNRAAIICLLLLVLACITDARKQGGHNKDSAKQSEKQAEVKKQHDAAHGFRKMKVHKDSISGRSGSAMDDPMPLVGRKLQQTGAPVTSTTVAEGMTVCLPAGAHAHVLRKRGRPFLSVYLTSCATPSQPSTLPALIRTHYCCFPTQTPLPTPDCMQPTRQASWSGPTQPR
jgi:hypothetical protein